MFLPLLLICGAAMSAAVVAYGTDPELARFAHGIKMIVLARRLEWPMVAVSLILCAVLLGVTISGRRRVWWLIGLAPVLSLFVRGFSSVYHPLFHLLDSPTFVSADQALAAVGADEFVVGFFFAGKAYALPYRALAASPLILLTDFDKRALVIWSVTANRATILPLDREARTREIEVISRPADSLLLFDSRLGQFIVGITGLTVAGLRPVGMGSALPTVKMPYSMWVSRHPDTQVLLATITNPSAPATPALPLLHIPSSGKDASVGQMRIALLSTTQPAAIPSDSVVNKPLNVIAGDTRILLMREAKAGLLHAYDRHVKEDLFLTFSTPARPNRKHPEATLIDSDSQSWWTADGRAVDGELKGERLREIPIEDGLYWGVMKFWMPKLNLIDVK